MPTIFEIRNADGSMHMDLSTRAPRLLGTMTITGSQPSGSFTHPGFSTGKPFYFPTGAWFGNFPQNIPYITPNANGFQWYYDSRTAVGSRTPVNILYGVY